MNSSRRLLSEALIDTSGNLNVACGILTVAPEDLSLSLIPGCALWEHAAMKSKTPATSRKKYIPEFLNDLSVSLILKFSPIV